MQQTPGGPAVVWRVDLINADMTKRGWLQSDLAERAFPVTNKRKARAASAAARMRVSRFLSGERQTARTAKAIALALGHKVDRYMVAREDIAREPETVSP